MKGWTQRITQALKSANDAVQGGLQEKVAEFDLWAVNQVNEAMEKFSDKTDQTMAKVKDKAKHQLDEVGKETQQQLRQTGKKLQHLARSAWKNIGK